MAQELGFNLRIETDPDLDHLGVETSSMKNKDPRIKKSQ